MPLPAVPQHESKIIETTNEVERNTNCDTDESATIDIRSSKSTTSVTTTKGSFMPRKVISLGSEILLPLPAVPQHESKIIETTNEVERNTNCDTDESATILLSRIRWFPSRYVINRPKNVMFLYENMIQNLRK